MDESNALLDPQSLKSNDTKARRAALAELGLSSAADSDAIRLAFRSRLKENHPDLTGGSDIALRRIILARDLLMSDNRNDAANALWLRDLAASEHEEDGTQRLSITMQQAIYGGEIIQTVHALEVSAAHEEVTSLSQTKALKIILPAGLREDDTLRLTTEGAPRPEQRFRIHIITENGTRIVGNDIHVITQVENRLLFGGGPAVIDTPHGPRQVHIQRDTPVLTLKGLGLPGTDKYDCGDLHVRLEARAPIRRPWSEAMGDFRQKWAS